ncbi:MAG: EFR1 family ferrodoxin [Bacteroidales bacterium]|nr:EFR1 family ferrodoxin [Bacteroidales bacterium]MBQ8959535.1 EFR1 family ferrodoxin [Bacteroidales bacterium]
MIFYFSGCGNSQHVAEQLAESLNDKLVFIPEVARNNQYDYTLAEGESLGFVFPVYSWAPPKLVLDFIKKLKIEVPEPVEGPTSPYIYFACTCGDECGHTEKIFRKAVEAKGWMLSACFSLQMPETYIGMPGFKLDTEENAQRKINAANAALSEFIPRLQKKESFSEMIVGGAAWLKSYLVNPGFNRFATDDKKYRSTEVCIHCGRCVEVCPLQNITLEEGRPVWHGNCAICMACYHHCPVNAIQYGKATKGKGQYWFGRRK